MTPAAQDPKNTTPAFCGPAARGLVGSPTPSAWLTPLDERRAAGFGWRYYGWAGDIMDGLVGGMLKATVGPGGPTFT